MSERHAAGVRAKGRRSASPRLTAETEAIGQARTAIGQAVARQGLEFESVRD